MLETANGLAIAGTVFLAFAVIAVVFLVTDFLFGAAATIGTTIAAGLLYGWFWYGLPLARRVRR